MPRCSRSSLSRGSSDGRSHALHRADTSERRAKDLGPKVPDLGGLRGASRIAPNGRTPRSPTASHVVSLQGTQSDCFPRSLPTWRITAFCKAFVASSLHRVSMDCLPARPQPQKARLLFRGSPTASPHLEAVKHGTRHPLHDRDAALLNFASRIPSSPGRHLAPREP